MKQYLEIVKFTKTQGLKGELRAQYFCDDPDEIEKYETLYLGREKTPVKTMSCRPNKNIVIIKLEGIDTVEEAQAFIGKTLYIDRNDVKLPPDTWFIQDLIGLKVVDIDSGRVYGVVDEILQNAPVDVYSVKTSENKQLLFPSIPDILIKTDIEAGKIYIRPIAGLFEE